MRIRCLIISLLTMLPLMVAAQAKDKAEADLMVWEELTAGYETENYHPRLIIQDNQVSETAEKGIWLVKGDSFQIKSLRSDFYICKKKREWAVLNDPRYPYESMTNLLLNRIEDNKHQLRLIHHQYGGKKPEVLIPMQRLYDVFARHMQLYASVTKINNVEIRAVLIFHQKRLDYIHMLDLRIPSSQLFDKQSTLTGDFYTNIPQHNVKSIFREKDQKNNETPTNEKIPVHLSDAGSNGQHSSR